MKPNDIVKVAANIVTAVGIGAVVGLNVFDKGTDTANYIRLSKIREVSWVKVPGKLFKRKAVVDGLGKIIEWR